MHHTGSKLVQTSLYTLQFTVFVYDHKCPMYNVLIYNVLYIYIYTVLKRVSCSPDIPADKADITCLCCDDPAPVSYAMNILINVNIDFCCSRQDRLSTSSHTAATQGKAVSVVINVPVSLCSPVVSAASHLPLRPCLSRVHM